MKAALLWLVSIMRIRTAHLVSTALAIAFCISLRQATRLTPQKLPEFTLPILQHVGNDLSSQQQSPPVTTIPIELPEACRTLHPKRSKLPKSPLHFREITSGVDGIPAEYVYTSPLTTKEPMSFIMYQDHQVQYSQIPLQHLPTNVTLICIPDGIVLDASMAGPYRQNQDAPIHIYQNKIWYPGVHLANEFVDRKPTVQHIPLLGVQVSAWTGFTFNHFMVDTLLRLGLVYDLLTSESDPLWSNAKIVVSTDLNKDVALPPMVQYVYDQLELGERLVPNNGWLAQANHTHRFDFLVIPDVTPHTKCGPNSEVVDPVFARGILRPIQTALGSHETNPKKYIVFAYRNKERRAVELHRRAILITALRGMLLELNIPLQVVEWSYETPQQTLALFRHAAVVIGPHGANLWNAAFMPPGGLLVEITSVQAEFLDEDCRTYGFSLANAASFTYALVESEGFHYESRNLMPEVEDVVEIVRAFLKGQVKNPPYRDRTGRLGGMTKNDNKSPKLDKKERVEIRPVQNKDPLVMNQKYIEYLETLPPISKKIHLFFPNKTITEHPELDIVKHGVLALKRLNPDWTVKIYDDADIYRIIQNSALLPKKDRELLRKAHIVEQSDVARLIVMYQHGGFYMDIDRTVNIPLEQVLLENTKMCMPTYYNVNFMQDIMCSSQKNRVFKSAIRAQLRLRRQMERRNGWIRASDVIELGPRRWNTVLAKVVFQRADAIEKDEMDSARVAINATGGVIVTRKDEWCDGFLVTPFDGCKGIAREPLYDLYGLGSWHDQVEARWSGEKSR